MIQLQFVDTAGLGSEAIKLFSRGWPSHVDAALPDGQLCGARSETIGAIAPGVQIRPAAYETFRRKLVVTLDATEDQRIAFWLWMHAQIGKPYDMLAIAAFAAARDWREPDSWFCSELVAAGLEACGWLPHPLANTVNEITPRDLLLVVSPWSRSADV